MIGNTVWLFSNEIIFEEVEFQESNFLGFVLVDEERGEIGKIISIDDFSGNVVFTLIRKGREILIPYNEHFLISCNESKKIITMQLPEGLLEQ